MPIHAPFGEVFATKMGKKETFYNVIPLKMQ